MGLIIQWLVVGQQADFFRIDLSQMLRLPALLVSEITVTGANGNRAGTTQPHITKVTRHIIKGAHVRHKIHRVVLRKDMADGTGFDVVTKVKSFAVALYYFEIEFKPPSFLRAASFGPPSRPTVLTWALAFF